jgi:hypothetical protein
MIAILPHVYFYRAGAHQRAKSFPEWVGCEEFDLILRLPSANCRQPRGLETGRTLALLALEAGQSLNRKTRCQKR